MPVKIEVLDDYELRFKHNDASLLLLPAIEIKPTENINLPYISKIDLDVRGIPQKLCEQIKTAYRKVDFGTNKLFKLHNPMRLRQDDCYWEEPLPKNVNCKLLVKVEYYDSDINGNPNLDEKIQVITCECNIKRSVTSTTPQEPIIPPTKEKEAPKPEVTIKDKNSQLISRKTANEIKANNNLTIDYPGWFAIDFGTSNSTVTLYDPKEFDPPNILPSEQETQLRTSLAAWINESSVDNLPGVTHNDWQSEWQKFREQLCEVFEQVEHANQQNWGELLFKKVNADKLLQVIRQIEISLYERRPWFRRIASKKLNQIYHEVFRVPPLEWQRLFLVQLDKDSREKEIPSELEVVSLEPDLAEDDPKKVKVILGDKAKLDRLNAIEQGEIIEGRFLHSPKRYFGKERSFTITLNGKKDKIHVNKLLQAAYAHLIQLTDNYRNNNPGQFALGDFYGAVVTYPTIASPYVRREIQELVESLGIKDVQMAYDEAVSVAIFFLWREFGANLNVGIESLKTRCHRDGDKWYQNVLVLDIGGGTTDLALIRLTLEEIDPFEPGEDRGDGGRYYKLTPKLLRSSGHLQLGGELITLNVFLLLKAAIADCLLTAVAEERLANNVLKVQVTELGDRFVNNDKFQKGSLLACVDTNVSESDPYKKDALTAAEKVIPTRWNSENALKSRIQSFYTLWEYAEKAKRELAQKRKFALDGQKISELLLQNDIELPRDVVDSLSVTINLEQFERAASPVIKEAINIAKELMENALKTENNINIQDRINKQQVDWLILSGKTCNLEIVQQELYRVFSKSEYFVWNPERVTFEPKYTKLATSVGACIAENYRQKSFDPQKAKDLLRRGANQLYINVKNLFYFLPCSFVRYNTIAGVLENIFQADKQLYQLKAGDIMAKCRSSWMGMLLSNDVHRQDFEKMPLQLWGSYNGTALMKKLEMNEDDFKKEIEVQFEINQKLEINLLICRGKPHYLITNETHSINVATATGVEEVIINNGQTTKVIFDIAVNIAESANAFWPDGGVPVFKATKDYSEELTIFRYEDNVEQPEVRGLVVELVPAPENNKHTFFFWHSESDKWKLIGELPVPKVNTEYPFRYYVSLNDKGILQVHAFDVPYWTGDSPECLKQEGCVFRDALQPQPNDLEEKRDPFCGIH